MVRKHLVFMIIGFVGFPIAHGYLSLNFAGAEIVRLVKELVPYGSTESIRMLLRISRTVVMGHVRHRATPVQQDL